MIQIKMAFVAAITAVGVGIVNWIIDTHFITGFLSGWWLSGWFN